MRDDAPPRRRGALSGGADDAGVSALGGFTATRERQDDTDDSHDSADSAQDRAGVRHRILTEDKVIEQTDEDNDNTDDREAVSRSTHVFYSNEGGWPWRIAAVA